MQSGSWKQFKLHLPLIKNSEHWKYKDLTYKQELVLPQGPSGESKLQFNSPSFNSLLSVYAEKAHASFWDTMKKPGSPVSGGSSQCKLALSALFP